MGIFLLVVIISANFFWRIFGHGNEGAFDKLRQEAKNNLAKNKTMATSASATPAIPPVPDQSAVSGVSSQSASPVDAMEPHQENSEPPSEDAEKPIDPTSIKTEEDTTDWQVYADEKGEFEFKYPTDANINYNGDLIRVTQNEKTWKLKDYSNDEKADLSTWYNSEFSEKERLNCTLSDSPLKVVSYEIKYVNPNYGTTASDKAGYFAISTDKKNVVRVQLGEETVENANKILATFKFTE